MKKGRFVWVLFVSSAASIPNMNVAAFIRQITEEKRQVRVSQSERAESREQAGRMVPSMVSLSSFHAHQEAGGVILSSFADET